MTLYIFYFYKLFFADGSALKVRLVGDSQPNSNRGVIEVLYSQTWGTVCKGAFDIDDAKVVCHMLGYKCVFCYIML